MINFGKRIWNKKKELSNIEGDSGIQLKLSKEKALKYFIYFLVFMLFCTIVSRAIYAMRLPKITVDTVKPGNIAHQVKTEGIVEAKDSQAIWTESDLRVASVFVKEGENIEAGTQIFQVDADSLAEKIEALKDEISQQQAQLDAAQKNDNQDKKDRQTAIDRANEDKETSLAAADNAITKAQSEVDAAQNALNQFPSKESYLSQAEQEDTEYQELLQKADVQQSELDSCKQKIDRSASSEWDEKYQTLNQTLQEKQDALNEAVAARSTAETTANRAIEDASKQPELDVSDTTTKQTLEENQKTLDKYLAIQTANGIITSETAGRIAKLNVAVGEMTPANAAVVLETAGDTVDFIAVVTKEDKEYLEDGAEIELKFDKNQLYEEASVKDIVPMTNEDGSVTESFQVTIELPSSVAEIGKTGELTATKTSDLYQSTVPLSAIYTNGAGYYVYIVQTTDTILGQEMTVEQRPVVLKDKNSTLAALDVSSGLTEGDSIVTGSTKELSAGAKVRLQEQ